MHIKTINQKNHSGTPSFKFCSFPSILTHLSGPKHWVWKIRSVPLYSPIKVYLTILLMWHSDTFKFPLLLCLLYSFPWRLRPKERISISKITYSFLWFFWYLAPKGWYFPPKQIRIKLQLSVKQCFRKIENSENKSPCLQGVDIVQGNSAINKSKASGNH